MKKTNNGRPAGLGSLYFTDDPYKEIKYCVGYCPNCKAKIGITRKELKELVEGMPGIPIRTLKRLLNIRVLIPK